MVAVQEAHLWLTENYAVEHGFEREQQQIRKENFCINPEMSL